MIKAIFFDWGDTLASYKKDLEKEMDRVLASYGLRWKNIFPYWKNFYYLRSKGDIKSDEEMFLQLSRVIQKNIPLKRIRDIRADSFIVPKEKIKIVKKLKKNYKIGILSNGVKGWIEKGLKKYKIKNLFDSIIISSEIGVRKPDAEIYYAALKSLSIKPEETIFVSDELCDDLVAAKGCGIKTIWYLPDPKNKLKIKENKIAKLFPPDIVIKDLKEIISLVCLKRK